MSHVRFKLIFTFAMQRRDVVVVFKIVFVKLKFSWFREWAISYTCKLAWCLRRNAVTQFFFCETFAILYHQRYEYCVWLSLCGVFHLKSRPFRGRCHCRAIYKKICERFGLSVSYQSKVRRQSKFLYIPKLNTNKFINNVEKTQPTQSH